MLPIFLPKLAPPLRRGFSFHHAQTVLTFKPGGVENSLNIFGIAAPGWFMKTEYRSAFFDRITLPETVIPTGLPAATAVTFKPWVQTISTSLVYRFNWGGARY